MSKSLALSLAMLLAAPVLAQDAPPPSDEDSLQSKGRPSHEDAKRLLTKRLSDMVRPKLPPSLLPTPLPTPLPFEVDSPADLLQAEVGLGYEIWTLDLEDLLTHDLTLKEAVHPTGTHAFLVMVGGRPVGQMELSWVNGAWEITNLGSAPLAQAIQTLAAGQGPFRLIRLVRTPFDLLEFRTPGCLPWYQLLLSRAGSPS